MPTDDFSHYAAPWLNQLLDDPDKQGRRVPDPTTFPVAESAITGDIGHIDGADTSADDISSPVDESDVRAAQSARQMAGLDVLAFYKSFRFIDRPPYPGHWGIFLLDAGIEGLARDLTNYLPKLPQQEARRFAREILLAHERYHFWIDAWALSQEITPILGTKFKRYEYYLAAKKRVELTSDDWEESLANHYAYSKLKRRTFSTGVTAASALRKLLLDSPSPYSDCFFNRLERAKKEAWLALAVANGMDNLASQMIYLSLGEDPAVLSASIQPVNYRHPVAGSSRCPAYLVKTTGYAALVQPFQGPTFKEFRKFLTKYLNGNPLDATNHEYFRIDNGQKIKYPNPHDKEVRSYELKGTLLKAGMTQKEFIDARTQTKNWTTKCPRPEPKPSLAP